jgi:hypothetical protein
LYTGAVNEYTADAAGKESYERGTARLLGWLLPQWVHGSWKRAHHEEAILRLQAAPALEEYG